MAKTGIRRYILARVRIAFLVVSLIALVIVYKMMSIQIVEGEKWSSKARGVEMRDVQPTRGSILADDGSLLATSLPFYRVAIDPTVADSAVFESGIDSLGILLSDFFKEHEPSYYVNLLREDRKNDKKYHILSRELISHEEYKKLSQFPIFREGRNKGGVIYEQTDKRFLPFNDLARRTIGFVTDEDSTQSLNGRGLEYSFNSELQGVAGEALYELIAGGFWKPVDDMSQVRPKPGIDIQTTIDINLQDTVHQILQNALRQYKAEYGSIILMEVETGKIKALVNLGINSNGSYVENNNYAVGDMGLAEPGSTFKLMSMAALFENEDIPISLKDSVQTGDGVHKYYDDAIMRDVSALGKLSVQEVFEKSSNVGMSLLVWKYFRKDEQKYVDYLKKFGLNRPLGFQMAGEAQPYLKSPSDSSWSGSTLPWMSIGYELKLSPLQTLSFYNAIANNGVTVQPIIVSQTRQAGKVLKSFENTTTKKEIISDKTVKILQTMLRGAVENGTAKKINTKTYQIAGKTGTAEKVRNGEYTEDHYTSFAGYFPADNPKYSCIVVIDDPKTDKRYAAEVAAPVFRQVSDVVYQRYLHKPLSEVEATAMDSLHMRLPFIRAGYRPDLDLVCSQLGIKTQNQTAQQWVKTKVATDTVMWIDNQAAASLIPDVRGMRLRDALYLLENLGMQVAFEGKGRIVSQSLNPGGAIQKGKTIYLKLKE
ncbi:penicillin-binding protein [Bernardetia sp.]|uniref:penicillin-binding protein n=1 Tax=Bernardetia sp. TaxID=1937974 RepID=UPI0025B9A139|nr:penicillin-binding protein [Bernardetia sp.]